MAADTEEVTYHMTERSIRSLYMHLLDAQSPTIRVSGDPATDDVNADKARRASLDRAIAILDEFYNAASWRQQWERGQ